jgi:hypothetical protein
MRSGRSLRPAGNPCGNTRVHKRTIALAENLPHQVLSPFPATSVAHARAGVAYRAVTQHRGLAITFDAERSLRSATPESFWTQGGSIELGTNTWRGLGVAANVTGAHTSSIGATAIPLSIVTTTFGPRYRWHADHRVSLYVEGLIGEGNGFKSLFPTVRGSQTSANSLAAQAGGGLEYRLSQHVAVRAVEAAWQHTQLPNGTNNIQFTFISGTEVRCESEGVGSTKVVVRVNRRRAFLWFLFWVALSSFVACAMPEPGGAIMFLLVSCTAWFGIVRFLGDYLITKEIGVRLKDH